MGLFKKKKVKKEVEKAVSQTGYKLGGLYMETDIDLEPINNKIKDNTDKINATDTKLNENVVKINTNTQKLNDQQQLINDNTNKINTNTNNINNNVNSITNINQKINQITNDLANANIANYKGTFVNNKTYNLGDLVSDPNNTNVYLSIKNNNTSPLTDNAAWKVITFTINTSDFVDINIVNALETKLTANINTNATNITNNKNEITNIKNQLNNLNPNKESGGYSFYNLDGTFQKWGLAGGGYLYNMTIAKNELRSLLVGANINIVNNKTYLMTIFIKDIFTNFTTPQQRNHTLTLIYNENIFSLQVPTVGFETIAHQNYQDGNPCRMRGYAFVKEL